MKSLIHTSEHFEAALAALMAQDSMRRNELFRIPAVRDLVVKDRFYHLFGANLQVDAAASSSSVTIEHNTDPERMFYADMSKRPDLIAAPLAALNRVRQNAAKMRVLAVGARTEAEIFSLVNAGFALDNIEAVDLFSYSPHIRIGDVHDLPFKDESFDVTVCGWVLEFCSDIARACSELRRVTREGGYLCIGGMHHPSSLDLATYNQRKHHDDRAWYASIKRIREAFEVEDRDFVFKSGIDDDDLDKRGDVVAIFIRRSRPCSR